MKVKERHTDKPAANSSGCDDFAPEEDEDVVSITLAEPITKEDLFCDVCNKQLGSFGSYRGHMNTQHEIPVLKATRVLKGDIKKQEKQNKKELKEKQKKLPRSVVDIKNLVPENSSMDQRAKILFQHIQKTVPLSESVVKALEKKQNEVLILKSDEETNGEDSGDQNLPSKKKQKTKHMEMVGEEKLASIQEKILKDSFIPGIQLEEDVSGDVHDDLSIQHLRTGDVITPFYYNTRDLIQFLQGKGFHEDVLSCIEDARITGLNIKDMTQWDFIESIGISRKGDVAGLARLFESIDNEAKQKQ